MASVPGPKHGPMTDRLPFAPGTKQYASQIEMYQNTPPSEGILGKEEGTGTFSGEGASEAKD